MKNIILLSLLFLNLFTNCSDEKTDEELLELDRKALAKSLQSTKVSSYKFGKIILRASFAEDSISPEFNEVKLELQKVSNIIMKHDTSSVNDLSLLEYISIYKAYSKIRNFVSTTDEDIFPTLTESYKRSRNDSLTDNRIVLSGKEKEIVQNTEHSILSAILILSRSYGKEVALYECSKTDPTLIPDSEIKTLLSYFRGFLFFEKGLYYLSEDEISRNITWLNSNQNIDLPLTRVLFQWGNLDNDKTHTAIHSLNHLFRGFDRLMMDRDIDEERALKDFEMFLKDAHEIGLDNEIIWSIETYYYLKNENSDSAILSLTKLQSSILLSPEDKERIGEIIEYLNERKSGKITNTLFDKFFLAKISTKYMFSLLSKVDWISVMNSQGIPYTDEMFNSLEKFNTFVDTLDKYTSTEALKESGKVVGEKVSEKGKSLWNKAKGMVSSP